MVMIARIGIDTSKGSFQLHGVDAEEQVVLRKTLRRKQFLEYLAKQEVGEIGLEACGASHHWARALRQHGLRVVLVPPQKYTPPPPWIAPGENNVSSYVQFKSPGGQKYHPSFQGETYCKRKCSRKRME